LTNGGWFECEYFHTLLCRGKWGQYELIKVPEIESFFNIYFILSAKMLTVVHIFCCHLHIFYYSTLQNRKGANFLFCQHVGNSTQCCSQAGCAFEAPLFMCWFFGSKLTKIEQMNYSTFLL